MKHRLPHIRLFLAALQVIFVALALAACGGGGNEGTATIASSSGGAEKVLDASGVSWTTCASEWGYCQFSGPQLVRYGTATQYVIVTLVGGTSCSDLVFGDPAYGFAKTCSFAPPASAVGQVWTYCASEWQYCDFQGPQLVRFGTPDHSVTLTVSGGTVCSIVVFGDPDYGNPKTCSYAPVTASATNWVLCASENQTCTFDGTAQVRYGTLTQNVIQSITGQTPCTNAVFGDPAYGFTKSCWYATSTAGPAGVNPPIVFNATRSGRAGNAVSIQGTNFGSTPQVYFDGVAYAPLQIVNSVGTTQLTVQLPTTTPLALVLRVANATGTSAQVLLNAALPLHLDTLRLTPGSAFRLFGRNLLLPGSTPTVMVGGIAATLDLTHSNEYMLTAVAPTTLADSAAAVITVDNGNGTGPATLDRSIVTSSTGSGDPFGLGVGWAADFSALSNNLFYAATDTRLTQHVVCNGTTDDSAAIQAAINIASQYGGNVGGVVQLPAGTCKLANSFNLLNNVVVQGAGKDITTLLYDANYAFYCGPPFTGAPGPDLAGVRNLTMVNFDSGHFQEGPLMTNSTRVFIQNVKFQLNTSRQMYLTENTNFVVEGTDFVQTTSISGQGPYNVTGSAGVVFENNTTTWAMGAPTFQQMHDAYIHANTFNHDASQLSQTGFMHSMAIDFAYRTAIVGNTFGVINGPVTDHNRNDGETILTEGGGGSRTENLGTVTSADSNSITDTNNTITVNPFGKPPNAPIVEDYGVAIVGGTGAGQMRQVTLYSGSKMTIDHAWDVVPDTTSTYATFVFGLEKTVIKDNILTQNPRGIWLYQTAMRDVDVINNSISEGGGIYLRSYQNLASHYFMPIYNVLVANNTVVNTTGNWGSYLDSVFVNSDNQSFGIGTLGVEIRSNTLTANIPNGTFPGEDYATVEGFMNQMRIETYTVYQDPPLPRMLGTLFENNNCVNCAFAIRLGTGVGGTTILNQQLVNGGSLLFDQPIPPSTETSTGTVIK